MKKIKISLILFIAIISIAINVSAQDFGISVQTYVLSSYVTPNGLQNYAEPVNQGSVTLTHKSGFFFDLWYSTGFNSEWATNWDDELDYTLGWSGAISPFNTSVLISYFDNFTVLKGPYNDVVKGSLQFDYPKEINDWWKISPFINYTTFIVPDKSSPIAGGNLYSLGCNNEVALIDELVLTPSILFMIDDGTFGSVPGDLFKFSSAFKLVFTDKLSINILEGTFYVPIGKRNMKNQFVMSTGVSWTL